MGIWCKTLYGEGWSLWRCCQWGYRLTVSVHLVTGAEGLPEVSAGVHIVLPSEPAAWLRFVWAFSHSQGNSWVQQPHMGMMINRVRKRTNNSFTCWFLLLLTANSMVTELLAKSFVDLEMHRGILVFPVVFYPLPTGSVFRDTILSPPRTEDSWSVWRYTIADGFPAGWRKRHCHRVIEPKTVIPVEGKGLAHLLKKLCRFWCGDGEKSVTLPAKQSFYGRAAVHFWFTAFALI